MPALRPSDPAYGVHLGLLPSDRSYWVVPGRLAAGSSPSQADPAEAEAKLRRVAACGFGYLVDLTEEGESNHDGQGLHAYPADLCRYAEELDRQVECVRRPIPDMGIPTVERMKEILNGLDSAIASGRRAYVHCWGGFGRTGTVVGCYLVRHGMAPGEEALAMIKYLRRTDAKVGTESPQTPEQRKFVIEWQAGR